ncbi:helix-hairpin-helix domain-containing protein, partial [bacterium]|nr:helix-hairpin-helix domain-containing protein [bacterium]
EEIYLPTETSEWVEIQEWLSEKRSGRVRLLTPKKGQRAKLVSMGQKNAQLLLDELKLQKLKAKDYLAHNVKALQRDLRLERPPKRIECFDISNIQGTDPVASMVTFVNGKPKKSDYRKFKIRAKSTPDDFAMMAEAVTRRHSGSLTQAMEPPDLTLIDGGKGQLSSVERVFEKLGMEDKPLAALAKRLDEVFVPGVSEAQNIPKTSSGLKLLQQIRDEAHRFAVTYHRNIRRKRTTQSAVDAIPGVGPARRKALLTHFGSVKILREASVDEIELVDGVPPALAKKIWQHFHFVDIKTDR